LITHISPLGSMDLLSQLEVDMLKRTASSDLYRLFRNCSLAVLNSGSQTDSSKELLERFESFDINVLRRERGVKLELVNPPEEAFVDGRIILIGRHAVALKRDRYNWRYCNLYPSPFKMQGVGCLLYPDVVWK